MSETEEVITEPPPEVVTKQTEFEDLDYELREKILSNIRNQKELQLSRQVCKSWEELINASFGIKLLINNLNASLLTTCSSAIELELNSFTRPIDISQVIFMQRLRVLTFHNIVVSYNLIPLLESAKNLVEVNFYEIVLDLSEDLIELPSPSSSELMTLQHVQKLSFHSWNFGSSLISLLCLLTKMNFKALETIQVHTGTTFTPTIAFQKIFNLENYAPEAFPTLHPLIRLILQNIGTIRLVHYGSVNNPFVFSFVKRCPSSAGPQPSEIPQLEGLIYSHSVHTEYVSILPSQTKLKILKLDSCRVETWPPIRDCILTNASTLEKISLNGHAFGHDWNCDIFETCLILKELMLKISSCPKINLHCLPKSLTHLELVGTVAKQELVKLFDLINLQQLLIYALGENLLNLLEDVEVDLEERVELDMLKCFIIKLPKLSLLVFKECSSSSLNFATIEQWIKNQGVVEYGISSTLHFYDVEGQPITHGFTLEIPEELDRGAIKINIDVNDVVAILRSRRSQVTWLSEIVDTIFPK